MMPYPKPCLAKVQVEPSPSLRSDLTEARQGTASHQGDCPWLNLVCNAEERHHKIIL